MVKDHSDSERGNQLPPHGLLFPISSKGSFKCIIPDRITHTTAFVTPVVEHWLERFHLWSAKVFFMCFFHIIITEVATHKRLWSICEFLQNGFILTAFSADFSHLMQESNIPRRTWSRERVWQASMASRQWAIRADVFLSSSSPSASSASSEITASTIRQNLGVLSY